MADIKDDIELKQVRAIMEQLAREQRVCITKIEIKPVQAILGKGNNGTVGAYVKQVKSEFTGSKAYDRANISMQLRSAIMEEIDRFADNARDNANENLETIERDNNELRALNDRIEKTINELQQELKDVRAASTEEARKYHEEIVKHQQQLDSSREAEAQLRSDLELCRKDFSLSNEKVMAMTKQNGKLEAEVETNKKEITDQAAQLHQSNNSRENAEQKAVLAEQASVLHQKTIDLLEKQKSDLERDIQEIKSNMSDLTTRNTVIQEKLDNANQERINDLKKAVSTPSKKKES